MVLHGGVRECVELTGVLGQDSLARDESRKTLRGMRRNAKGEKTKCRAEGGGTYVVRGWKSATGKPLE
ncbi:uncharacterized protein J3R85_002819 [Psidium guajava]|nr:uncharacterized protein J3R85_002819 [Psidium guajava]